jgi:hypothetical protein
MKNRAKRVISMNVLPGEPLDGSGRVCIHLFVQDEQGLFTEPHVLHPVYKDGVLVKGQLEARATRGRLACDPKRDPTPKTVGNVTTVTPRTDDPRAVNCPKCLASKECVELLQKYKSAEMAQ